MSPDAQDMNRTLKIPTSMDAKRPAHRLRGRLAAALVAGAFVVLLLGAPAWGLWPRATYTDDYIEQNRGKVLVEIPETFELANVALALTKYGQTDGRFSLSQGDYYDRVMEHFKPYANHPLIPRLVTSQQPLIHFYGVRENSVSYTFDGDNLAHDGLYRNVTLPNRFGQVRELLEDFARESGFREFYKENAAYYEEQIKLYRERVPLRAMWTWLEEQFPARYDCYKVVFSPLVGATHSTQGFSKRGFKEIVMFVCAPSGPVEGWSEDAIEGSNARVLFTEIDHNYVNPITDRYRKRVAEVFGDLDKWNGQDFYPSASMTFNEYMTWAVFTLWAHDRYEPDDFEAINREVVHVMVNLRKFVRFEEFNDKLLELWVKRAPDETVPDLYPKILDWAEAFSAPDQE